MPYLTLAEWKSRSSFSSAEIVEFLALPGRATTFDDWSEEIQSDIDDPLRGRYEVPFAFNKTTGLVDPTLAPKILKKWSGALLDERFLMARRYPGAEGSDDIDVNKAAERVREEIKAAADRDRTAHHELPLKASDPTASGVSRGGPIAIGFNTIYGFNDAKANQRDGGGW